MEDDGASLDGGDEGQACKHGQVSLLRLGLGRDWSTKAVSIAIS